MRQVTLQVRPSLHPDRHKLVTQPPETLERHISRDDDPLMTVDVDHLSAKEIDRLYADLDRRGELQLTRREKLRFRQMKEILILCLVPYVCLLAAYIVGWVAWWMGVLR